jgi:hypothetical protein
MKIERFDTFLWMNWGGRGGEGGQVQLKFTGWSISSGDGKRVETPSQTFPSDN